MALRCAVARLVVPLALAACAPLPAPPDHAGDSRSAVPGAQAGDPAIARAIARHRQLATQYRDAGDHAAAAAQWQILTLLAPQDPTFRQQREDALEAKARATRESLEAARAARRSGQTERALQAYLRVLAQDPGNDEAARAAREIDRQKYARIQQDRAARARPETMGAAPAAAARPLPAEPVGDGYDVEQALEMLAAGDLAGGLRDLRDWVAANPGNRATRRRIGSAVHDKARELEKAGAREQALTAYDAALALRGESVPEWSARANALRRALEPELRKPTPAPR